MNCQCVSRRSAPINNRFSLILGLIQFLEKFAEQKRRVGDALFEAAENATNSGFAQKVLIKKLELLNGLSKQGPEVGSAILNSIQVWQFFTFSLRQCP